MEMENIKPTTLIKYTIIVLVTNVIFKFVFLLIVFAIIFVTAKYQGKSIQQAISMYQRQQVWKLILNGN